MKISPTKAIRKGFTLIEMALAIALTLGIAAVLITLVQQQMTFTSSITQFNFLREDAPQINVLMTNLITQADDYSIHTTTSNAKSGANAITADGRALRLRFRLPDGSFDYAIISFEVINGQRQLNYYRRNSDEQNWPVSPTWVISSKPDVVNFSNNGGILEINLVGKYGEEFTFAGNPS
ncbi:MAG: hypothetical protein AAF733_00430 [Verrucomicrobiota bacterium]